MNKRSNGLKFEISEEWTNRISRSECPVCGKRNSEWNRRKDFRCCSKECTIKYHKTCIKLWADLRIESFCRDNLVCAMCSRKFKAYVSLVADHIIPIALDGEEYNLDNIQTLCIECNKLKTVSDLKKIAEQRVTEKKQTINTQINFKPD